ncbi:MAG: peptide-methionine (R)-S-oxide reductase MsrB [Candidatus Spechtbacterales bacterium]
MKNSNNNKKWKEKLTPEQYKIMREGGTEAPFTGEYLHTRDKGIYKCAACGNELFVSDTKFDSGTGWPSFTEPKNKLNVELRLDKSAAIERVEVVCKKCGAHLGHVFDDGPAEKGGKRYCINSACLKLQKQDQ